MGTHNRPWTPRRSISILRGAKKGKRPTKTDHDVQKQFEKDSDKGWDEYDKNMREHRTGKSLANIRKRLMENLTSTE